MKISVPFGLDCAEFDADETCLMIGQGATPAAPVSDLKAAVRAALESPRHWPSLRRALTPDDHVAVVIDEQLPQLPCLLLPILEHLTAAGVQPDAITLVCPPSASQQPWLEELPDDYADVRVEVHDPATRNKLSYLATTRQGRRLYINRSVVDADQVIVLSGRRYHPVLGHAGAETAVYPALCDQATRSQMLALAAPDVPGETPWPVEKEAAEVAWLLGAPFLVQVIEGAGDEIAHVLAGSLDSAAEGIRLLGARWRMTVPALADLILASISGDPARHDFATLAQALACAARVVQPGGRIVLLTQVTPSLGQGAELIRNADSPEDVVNHLADIPDSEGIAVRQWAGAVDRAQVYLLSGLEQSVAEELFTTPLERASQAQRLITPEQTILVVPDAHKMLVVQGAGRAS